MCFPSSSNDNSSITNQQAQQSQAAAANQAAITSAQEQENSLFAGYNDNYYNGLANNYTSYYTPQLQQQQQQAANSLLYSQANKGISNSSATQYENELLNQEGATDLQNIQSGGQNYANSAKQQVGNLQSNLSNQIQTVAANPSSVITPNALNQLNIQSVSSMTPLTGVFSVI